MVGFQIPLFDNFDFLNQIIHPLYMCMNLHLNLFALMISFSSIMDKKKKKYVFLKNEI